MGTLAEDSRAPDAQGEMIASDSRTFVCQHVRAGAPILAVYFDGGPDAHLAVLCGADEHPPGSVSVYAWGCICGERPELRDLAPSLYADTYCHRASASEAWLIEPLPAEDEAA